MKLLKKLYDKSQIWFSVLWIVAYCVMMSIGDALSALIGIEKSLSAVIGIILSAILILFLRKYGLMRAYGLCAPKASGRSMLYYVPIALMLTASRKRTEHTSRTTINFSVFRRIDSCKVLLYCDSLHQNPQKIYSPYGACSFKRIDFFIDEPNFPRNIQIFKGNSVMYMGKSIS